MRLGFEAKRIFQNHTGLGNYSRTIVSNFNRFFPENQIVLFTPKIIENSRTAIFLKPPYKIHTSEKSAFNFGRTLGYGLPLNSLDIDIYHGLSHEIPIFKREQNVKYIVTIHDLIYKHFPKDFNWLDRKIYDLKFSNSILYADHIIAISQATKNDILGHYNILESKITVLPQTFALQFSIFPISHFFQYVKKKFGLPHEFILNVGSIIKRKNIEIIIKCFGRYKLKMPLIIVGSGGTYKKYILDLIKKFDLSDQIIFISSPSMEELNALYRLAKFTIYPSLIEGFGLPVLESIVAGTPVITTSRSSLLEAGGNAAIYFDGLQVEKLYEHIDMLWNNRYDLESFNQNRLSHIRQFDAEKLSNNLNFIYQKLLI